MKMADVYSFWLFVHENFSEDEPFEDLNIYKLRKQVGCGNTTPSLDILRNNLDVSLISLMENCWSRKPTYQLTMKLTFSAPSSWIKWAFICLVHCHVIM